MEKFSLETAGKVESISDGICLISGLEKIAVDSILTFASGCQGLVIGFTDRFCQAIVFGDFTTIRKGDYARVSDKILKIPINESLLGRVIDPLGNPLDGKGEIISEQKETLERPAKTVFERELINQQVETGFLIIDSLIPIGRGQRELFISEKKIGKEETAVSVMINQVKNSTGIYVVYVTVGAQTSFIKRTIEKIEKNKAEKNTIFIVGRASDSAPLNYLAPMAGVTIAEGLAMQGKDVLIIFDNLTRHARIYRQISLLLKRAPGREAYPGDIFYLHSRLLERCGKFSSKVGGGSITAIPLVEIVNEDVTDYITTNLMSITDGHVLFTRSLFHQGRRPAIDTEYSVSRIGGKAQTAILRDLANDLKLKIGQYNEVESLANFGTELQEETLILLERGKRIYGFLNQDQDSNILPSQQCAIIHLLLSEFILKWPVEVMDDLRKSFLKFLDQAEVKTKIETAFKAKNLEEVNPVYNEICQTFIDSPDTIRPLDQETKRADKENLQDLLKEMDKKR